MDPDQMREPENARISEDDSGTRSYSVVPAVQGTELVEEQVEKMCIRDSCGAGLLPGRLCPCIPPV